MKGQKGESGNLGLAADVLAFGKIPLLLYYSPFAKDHVTSLYMVV